MNILKQSNNLKDYLPNFALLFILLLSLTLETYSQNKVALALEECIKIGLENNKAIKISKSKVESASAKSKETDASLLPSLKFNGGYTRLSEVDPFEVNTPYGKMSISTQVFDVFTLRLSASQPIFTGYRLQNSSDMMELQKAASENDYMADLGNLTFDIKNAYWNLYKALEYYKSIKSNKEMMQAHLDDIQNFYDAGMALFNDVLKVKVQLANTDLMLLDAENAINLSMISLNTIIGLPIDTKIEILTMMDTNIVNIPDVNLLLDTALVNRPELKGMELRVKAIENSVNIAKSGWYPQIFASANYYFNKPNSRIMPTRNEFIGTWDIGITISYDVFNWLTVPHQVEQAQASLNQTILGLQQLKDVISLEVSQNYLSLKKAIDKIRVARVADEQAKENVRITKEKFLAGLATNTDLLDAENASLVADINLINSYIDYEINYSKLLKSLGK